MNEIPPSEPAVTAVTEVKFRHRSHKTAAVSPYFHQDLAAHCLAENRAICRQYFSFSVGDHADERGSAGANAFSA